MCSATGEPQGANLSGVLRTEHTVGAAGTLMPTRREPTCKLAANDLGATGRGHPHIVGGLPPGRILIPTAIARIVRRSTTGAIGNSAARFGMTDRTVNSAVPR